MDQAGRAIELPAIVWPISGFHSRPKLEQARSLGVSCPHPRWWACVISNTTAPVLENIILCQYSSRANDNWVVCWAGWVVIVGTGYTAIPPCSCLVPQLHGRTALNPSLVWLILGWRSYWGCTIRVFSDKSMPGGRHCSPLACCICLGIGGRVV